MSSAVIDTTEVLIIWAEMGGSQSDLARMLKGDLSIDDFITAIEEHDVKVLEDVERDLASQQGLPASTQNALTMRKKIHEDRIAAAREKRVQRGRPS